ncbi:transporter [Mucilaginibacter litoreus]|uniref:Transporter n=1 Tax=Mucilaginibacter litoreus TaxID=1048221 RepID=A0ABW3AY08_9SPHI
MHFIVFISAAASAQDPKLPGVNFGLTNLQAGKAKPPGLYYLQHIQMFQPSGNTNSEGKAVSGSPLTSYTLSLQQLMYISRVRVLKSYLGFNLLVPLVRNSSANEFKQSINPNPLGDAALGVFLQWYDQHIGKLPVSFQLGGNLVAPTGSFYHRYDINPGTNRYRFIAHFEFTAEPLDRFAVSVKNNFYFYTRQIDQPDRPGPAYNLNYALELKLSDKITLEAAGYYLAQLGEDSYNGDNRYYQHQIGINDTRENILGIGPGIGIAGAGKSSMEIKCFWESEAKNRPKGFRMTILLGLPL